MAFIRKDDLRAELEALRMQAALERSEADHHFALYQKASGRIVYALIVGFVFGAFAAWVFL
jgi:hypothetical protein